uniref:Thioredoxin-related transmembrane protein 2 homolog isoform X2 n=1 Tax=Elaeis guineensis var. tenera TaxID=51953 RepID=A0A6I9RGB1_ELAGV|nr:thioredoxin-related transmembrane protein 2 homolog isoform X2 [Elaeis guineensis]
MEAAKTATANGKNRNHPFPWLNLLVTEPFYLLHFLAFFSYFVVRSSVSHTLSSDLSHRLLRREVQAILTFLVLVSVKMVKEETWEALIADTLFYAKGFLFAVALVIDYHLAFCYLLGFIVIYVVCQQPPYDGLGDSSQLTPLQLESLLTEGNTSRFWLVEFRTLCSSTCIRTSRVFPELSTIYSNKNISFGIVDIGHFPTAAEKFGVSLWGQLPTYILFDNAVEVSRFPDFNSPMPTISKSVGYLLTDKCLHLSFWASEAVNNFQLDNY